MIRAKIETIITNFEKRCKGPIQYTDEWYAMRIPNKDKKRGRIGGSEISSLIGVNKYKTLKELMLQKQGKKVNNVDNIMVHMGSLLEEITVLVYEHIFNTKVYAKNISIIDPANLNDFIFSPDGLSLLPKINNKISLTRIEEDSKCCPVLIEIKNPWSRPLARNGNVPTEYMAQIQAGLIAAPLAHAGLFIDCDTKLCAYEDLFNNEYNKILYSRYQPPDTEIISRGIILFTGKIPYGFWKKDCCRVEIGKKELYDFGDCAYKNTHVIVKSCKSNLLESHYFPIYDNTLSEDSYINNLIDKVNSDKIVGIMCYKVFDITYTICHRDKDMIKTIRTELNKYSQGELDIDEDYVPRKRKRSPSAKGMPNLAFDFDTDTESDNIKKKETFSFDSDY